MSSAFQDLILSADNYVFKGIIIFLLSGMTYGLLQFVLTSFQNNSSNGMGIISNISLLICLFVSPIYLILGFLKFYYSLDENNKSNTNQS